MRILILNWRDPRGDLAGGAERYVLRLAEIWSTEGHEVTIFGPGRRGRVRADGIDFVSGGGRHSVFPAARAYLRRHGAGYDLVLESVSTRPFFAHKVVGQRAAALYHQMAIDVWNAEYPLPVSWIGRHLLEPHWARRMRSARVIAVSRSTAHDLAAFGVASLAVIPPGHDSPVQPVPRALKNPPRLLFMGRLVRQKCPQDALTAFELVRRRFPQARLDVLGDGPMRAELDRLSSPGVEFHGFVSENEKARRLDDADLMLMPATREGWGIALMEAAAHGVPVVAYDVGGLRDSVVAGHTGLLCPPSPRSLAEGAVQLLGDPAAWNRMSGQAREWAAGFSWQGTARAVMSALTTGPAASTEAVA
jgi:glycosyltransferase involved in cell wall biosynthesis